MLLRTRKKKYS